MTAWYGKGRCRSKKKKFTLIGNKYKLFKQPIETLKQILRKFILGTSSSSLCMSFLIMSDWNQHQFLATRHQKHGAPTAAMLASRLLQQSGHQVVVTLRRWLLCASTLFLSFSVHVAAAFKFTALVLHSVLTRRYRNLQSRKMTVINVMYFTASRTLTWVYFFGANWEKTTGEVSTSSQDCSENRRKCSGWIVSL